MEKTEILEKIRKSVKIRKSGTSVINTLRSISETKFKDCEMLINQLTKTLIQFCSVEFREIENQSKKFHFKLIDKMRCIQT